MGARRASEIIAVFLIAAFAISPPAFAGPTVTKAPGAVPAPATAPDALVPAFDSRDAERTRLANELPRGFAVGATVRDARRALGRSLGPTGVLEIDPLTQTPRDVQRLGGALTTASSRPPGAVALDYVRARLTAFGLTDDDLATLHDGGSYTSSDGVTHVRWTQSYRGIPAFDNALVVNVDRGGRVIDVTGAPRHDLAVDSTTPVLNPAQALRAVQAAVGDPQTSSVVAGPSGPTRATTFTGGDRAHLVLFGAGTVRLAWDVTDAVSTVAVYDAIVDATTGRVLSSENLVDFASAATVFAHYPGAAQGGDQQPVDITTYLTPGATTLTGPNAHVYTDPNGDGRPSAPEEVGPSSGEDWIYPFTDFTSTNTSGACLATAQCSWDHTVTGSWLTNEDQAATQLFWFVNEYHDHLAADPIDFTDASGAFDGDDPLQARVDTGAALDNGNPDAASLENATMLTRPDGQSPLMTTELFSNGAGPFRDVNGADDAATVFHEYTHGLSNRLITNADGTGALSKVQSGAMGEGWSDWYAMDEVVDLGLDTDSDAPGEIDFGEYTDAAAHTTRSEPMDCPVDATAPACPGVPDGHPGGYTYGDMGHLCSCGNEVHFDGEIWGQTLWDLRTALIADAGDPILGSHLAEQLVTGAMRLSPPQPSMLDERNAILAEDTAAFGGRYDTLIWHVFADRGMGWLASTLDANDGAPIEDFSMPPTPDRPIGSLAGTVTGTISGLPMAGVRAGLGGHDTNLGAASSATTLAAVSDAAGRYAVPSVPVGTYPQLVAHGPTGYDRAVAGPVIVTAGQTTTEDVALQRDWAASAGGASLTTNDDSQSTFGCGAANLIDQSPHGWSTINQPANPPTITIALPQPIDVTRFAINPTATCSDDASAGLKQYRIDTSLDGTVFHESAAGTFDAGAVGKLNAIAPTAAATAVKQVRLTMLSPQSTDAGSAGASFIDATEFEVFGGPPNVLPSGTLTATPNAVQTDTTVALQASFSDSDSKIMGYKWDFDGDGSVDATTSAPTTTHVYALSGTFAANVAAQDFRGGAGDATANVRVTNPPPIGQPPMTVTVTVTVPAPAPPVQPKLTRPPKPTVKLRANGRRGISFTVTFASRGSVQATITASQALARTLHLHSTRFVIGTLRAAVTTTKPKTLTIKLSASTLKALATHHVKTLHAILGVTAKAADGQIATANRHVTITR